MSLNIPRGFQSLNARIKNKFPNLELGEANNLQVLEENGSLVLSFTSSKGSHKIPIADNDAETIQHEIQTVENFRMMAIQGLG